MRAWVFDLDGVIWRGDTPIEGGIRGVQQVIAAGRDVLFVTNFSYSLVAEQEAKLARFGIDARGRVITSAMAAAELVHEGERALVCAGPGVVEALQARRAEIVAGKPYPAMCEAVWHRLGRDRLAVVVGDRPDTDGRFARALGYEFALVLSGVTPVAGGEPVADYVGDDASTVVAQLEHDSL